MIKSILISILLLCVETSIAQTQDSTKFLLCHNWKVSFFEMTTKGVKNTEKKDSMFFCFKEDYTYSTLDKSVKEEGKWSFDKKIKKIIINDEKEENVTLDLTIELLTKNELILIMNSNKQGIVKIYCTLQ